MEVLNIVNNLEIEKLNTEQLDKVPVIDLHSSLLVIDSENIPAIIKALSQEKLQALIDISSWDKDNFNPVSFSTWMNVLLSFPPIEASKYIKKINRQEMQLFISSVLDVQWLDTDELYDGNPYISPDNAFIMFPKDEGSPEIQTAIELINIAYLESMAFGRGLCIDAMTSVYSIVEEESRRFKEARLSDEGVPSYMDALELFHFENPTKLLKSILKMVGDENYKKSSNDKEYIISQFAVVPKNYWDDVFKIAPELVDDIQVELSALLTASIVINNVASKDPKHIKDVVERSRCYFNIGLELIKENSDHSLSEVVQYVKLRHIFRLGFSLLVDLRNNAIKIKTALDALNRPDITTPDEEEFLRALHAPIPMIQKDLTEKAKQFETLDQLKDARKRLSDIASRLLRSNLS